MYLFYPKTMSIYFPQQNQDEYQAAGTSKVKVFTAFFRSMAALENITFLQHIHTVGMGGMMGNGYPGNLQDKLMLKVCRNIFFLQSLTWYFVLLFENELIFETCVIQDEKQTFSYETQGAIPDVSTSTPSIPSVSRPKKGDPSLDVSTNFLISTKAPTTIGKKKNKPSPDLLLSSIDLLPFPESERTAGKSHHHQWKKTDGFSFGYATICNLHMPTSTPSKDNILAPTSSCT